MRSNTDNIRDQFGKFNIDALLISKIENIRYLTGFSGSTAAVLISEDKQVFITDSRYTEQANKEIEGFEIRTYRNIIDGIADFVNRSKYKALGVEANNICYGEYIKIEKGLDKAILIPTYDIVENIRVVKGPNEIANIRSAIEISRSAFEETLSIIGQGALERDIAVELEYNIRRKGAEAIAFDFIIASGNRGGLPHGTASLKKLVDGELVIIDFGAKYRGYFSDCTRTLCIGDWDEKKYDIYNVVLSAQKEAIKAVKDGVSAEFVDNIARSFIKRAGYGERFGHGTGHGVGLEIHEAPRLAAGQDVMLKAGMVVTIEPGIYIPDRCGVRIEDMVLVNEDGCEVLTSSIPKL